MQVEIPRDVYVTGEPIPIYFTIPIPDPSIFQDGLRLRNIKVELIRVVQVGSIAGKDNELPEGIASGMDVDLSCARPGNAEHTTVMTRSGTSCRFHPTRPVRVRLVLHPSNTESSLGITQSTLLHQISFFIQFDISFFSTSSSSGSQSQQASISASSSFPITILPPPAPIPEGGFGDDVETAYRKKYDRPPTKTNRSVDDGPSAGPAPPPFDEPETPPESSDANAPPSFFAVMSQSPQPPTFLESEASSSHIPSIVDRSDAGGSQQPPSFLESESDALQPHFQAQPSTSLATFAEWAPRVQGQPELELRFSGEGSSFGFVSSEQFDGLSHSFTSRSQCEPPPPALSSSAGDSEIAELSDLIQPINLDVGVESDRPPPPPPLDDPMDPPPAIDAELSSLSMAEERDRGIAMGSAHSLRESSPSDSSRSTRSNAPQDDIEEDEARPPPYLNPVSSSGIAEHGHGQAIGSGPPPYMDLRH